MPEEQNNLEQTSTIESLSPNDFRLLRTLKGNSSSVNCVDASPDGKYLASGSDDETLKLWDVNSGECVLILKGHSDVVNSVVASPDRKYLASGSVDGTIKLWDVNSGECIRTLKGYSDIVKSVCWSHDGDLFSYTVKIWSIN